MAFNLTPRVNRKSSLHSTTLRSYLTDLTLNMSTLFRFCQSLRQSPAQKMLKCYNSISEHILHRITAFLTNKTQRVLLDRYSSDTVPVSSGVPQRTIQGSFLFFLYINDVPLLTPNSSTRLFRAVKTIDTCRLLQKDLDVPQQWKRI